MNVSMSICFGVGFILQNSRDGREVLWQVRLRLYFDQFGQIPLVFPPVNEQAQIVDFLDHKTQQIDELISAEQRKIELLKEYRQSLISEVVTGKIDVRNEV